jgi:hypothetical protein
VGRARGKNHTARCNSQARLGPCGPRHPLAVVT